ncbi:protein of unknown function [Burkholderia multivorans]
MDHADALGVAPTRIAPYQPGRRGVRRSDKYLRQAEQFRGASALSIDRPDSLMELYFRSTVIACLAIPGRSRIDWVNDMSFDGCCKII